MDENIALTPYETREILFYKTDNGDVKVEILLYQENCVGLSMMCYTMGKEKRTALGDFQLSGRLGKLLYCLCRTASCLAKSSKE